MPKEVVIVPTYNEAENLPILLEQLSKLPLDVLVVDDDSPDGTGRIAKAFANTFERIFLLSRHTKEGLAPAYRAGFDWAIERDYDLIAQMDADGSHRVQDLERIIARAHQADLPALVIGSRWIRGGRVVGWPKWRELLSRSGNLYIRAMLSLPVADATAGLRVYSAEAFALLKPQTSGYVFQTELTRAVHKANLRVAEVPIVFPQRRSGYSKMSSRIFWESLVQVTRWAFAK